MPAPNGGGGGTVPEDDPGGTSGSCKATGHSATITLTDPAGAALGCRDSGRKAGVKELSGHVLDVTVDTVRIDTCPPAAACLVPSIWTLRVQGMPQPWNFLLAPTQNVSLKFEANFPWGCVSRVTVKRLDKFGGSPIQLLVAASEGTASPFADDPFEVDSALVCSRGDDPPSCGATAGNYGLRFRARGGTSSTVGYLGMGESGLISLPSGDVLRTQNLLSQVSGACDDYWQWSYLVTAAPIR